MLVNQTIKQYQIVQLNSVNLLIDNKKSDAVKVEYYRQIDSLADVAQKPNTSLNVSILKINSELYLVDNASNSKTIVAVPACWALKFLGNHKKLFCLNRLPSYL
ncbi:hypothetical protein DYD21_00655 [Rhodohalobacter sp. SW132]|nr:hypothetical protein DYD21_00655 [Rhodohalobacter sp. SW132]